MRGQWDHECDVVVVGFGAAGSATAIESHDLGLDVVVLEKQTAERHTPSAMLSGAKIMVCADDPAVVSYLDACAAGLIPREVSAAWAAEAATLRPWLDELGLDVQDADVAEHPGYEGSSAVTAVAPGRDGRILDRSEGRGAALFRALSDAVRARGCDVRYGTPVQQLMREGDRIVGVRAGSKGSPMHIRARRGVALTCGGFEYDEWLKANHLPAPGVRFYGNPGNEGDGIRLAQQVGAGLWHMNQAVGRGIGSFPFGDPELLNVMIFIDPPGYVITDRHGLRFADESSQAGLRHDFYHHMLHYDVGGHDHPRIPSYWFFDESRRLAAPLTNPGVGLMSAGVYRWSDDNAAEIARGWIHTGATIAEAAAAAGVTDPGQAQRTVDAYNRMCADGRDTEHGRPADTLAPIDRPPFYCVPLWPGGSHTPGGPQRDPLARILDVNGMPIPGLYGAGELGQAIGRSYPAPGASLSDALCFGRIAARSMAADSG